MKARDVRCPICKADVGRPCERSDGRYLPWRASHEARVRLAAEVAT